MHGMVRRRQLLLAGIAAAAILAGCSSASNVIPIRTVNPAAPGQSTLQFKVGTANIFGTETGLNVVSTLRQPNGLSAVLVSTPTITGAFTLPATGAPPLLAEAAGAGADAYSTGPSGPSALETATGSIIEGTPQTVHPGTPVCDQVLPCAGGISPNVTTFGQSGGIFGMGVQPANSTNNGVPATFQPYPVPLWDNSANDAGLAANTFCGSTVKANCGTTMWGGPPAFDQHKNGMGFRDGLSPLGQAQGNQVGLSVFDGVTAKAGAYNLSVQIPTGFDNNGNPTFTTVTQSASIATLATLPTLSAPALTFDGSGGASFVSGALPAGVTEEYLEIVDQGPGATVGANCQGALGTASTFPVYYTIVIKGAGTVTLGDANGPNLAAGKGPNVLTPAPSICTAAQNTAALGAATPGDTVLVYLIGFDYDAFAAAYPNSNGSNTPLSGIAGQADISISAPLQQVSP